MKFGTDHLPRAMRAKVVCSGAFEKIRVSGMEGKRLIRFSVEMVNLIERYRYR